MGRGKAGEEPLVSLEALRAGFARSGQWRRRPSGSEPRVLRETGVGVGVLGPRGDLGAPPRGRRARSRPPAGRCRRRWRGGALSAGPGAFLTRSRIKQCSACWAARAPGPSWRGGMSGSPGPRREPCGWPPLGGPGVGPAVRMRTERYRYLL